MARPRLSVVIVNYRSWKRLSACLDSIETCCREGLCPEVIVVDNHSGDGRLPEFQERYAGFRFIASDENFGFAHGCNLGASEAAGEFLLFLNPDTIVTAGALSGLLGARRCASGIYPAVVPAAEQRRPGRQTGRAFSIAPHPHPLAARPHPLAPRGPLAVR
jgi:GT2 family glycosyltransferase